MLTWGVRAYYFPTVGPHRRSSVSYPNHDFEVTSKNFIPETRLRFLCTIPPWHIADLRNNQHTNTFLAWGAPPTMTHWAPTPSLPWEAFWDESLRKNTFCNTNKRTHSRNSRFPANISCASLSQSRFWLYTRRKGLNICKTCGVPGMFYRQSLEIAKTIHGLQTNTHTYTYIYCSKSDFPSLLFSVRRAAWYRGMFKKRYWANNVIFASRKFHVYSHSLLAFGFLITVLPYCFPLFSHPGRCWKSVRSAPTARWLTGNLGRGRVFARWWGVVPFFFLSYDRVLLHFFLPSGTPHFRVSILLASKKWPLENLTHMLR